MNVFVFILFGAFVITGFTFTYILAHKGKNVVSLSFLIITGFLEIWIASDFVVTTKIFLPYNLVILKLFSFSWIFIGVLFINFVFVFLNMKKNWIYYTLFVCAILFSILSVFTGWIFTGSEAATWGIIEKRGILYQPVGLLMVAFPIFYSSIILIRETLKTTDQIRKKQILYLVAGSIISISVGLVTDLIMPLIYHGFMISASFSASILSLFVYRATTKYQFLVVPLEETVYELFSNIYNGVILLNKQNEIIQINPSAINMLGLNSRSYLSTNINTILPGLEIEKNIKNEEMHYEKPGKDEFLLVSVTHIYKPDIATTKIIILQDITELKIRAKELEKLNEIFFKASITDVLTGFNNRQELYKRIEEEKNRISRNWKMVFSILFIDLDNFKYYNDTFGHAIGDIILKEFSYTLKECVRAIDFICRFGGDEFVIILTETDAERAAFIAARIQMEMKSKRYYKPVIEKNLNHSVSIPTKKRLGCSIGVAQYESSLMDNTEELIARADRALYQAKRHRKGGCVIWTLDMKKAQEITEINQT